MIQLRTMLKVADNTGAKIAQCIKVLGGSGKRTGQLGDIIVVAIKKAEPRKIVKTHEVTRAVIVRQVRPFRRKDGSYIRFDENAIVILDAKTKKPKGGRIFGPIPREMREKGFDDIVALAAEII